MEVGRYGETPVSPVAEEGLQARFAEQGEDLEGWRGVDDGSQTVSFAGASRAFDEDVNSWEEGKL